MLLYNSTCFRYDLDSMIYRRRTLLLLAVILCFFGDASFAAGMAAGADGSQGCDTPGWFPEKFGLKDHALFWYKGEYYIISTYVSPVSSSPLLQDRFVYAKSKDLCNWEEIGPVLTERTPDTWDEAAIWAPFVFYENGLYYLYYTGVTETWTQSIMLATSNDPADPHSWVRRGMIFQPSHPGAVWKLDRSADCRDPFLIKIGEVYYLYYTGRDQEGGIIGVASAPTPIGPWTDLGRVVTPVEGEMLESPFLVNYQGRYFLFYNLSLEGEYYRVSERHDGGFGEASPFTPGWAHELWQSVEGEWFTSYLTDYSVTINRLTWIASDPPQPIIEWARSKLYLPLINDESQEFDGCCFVE